MAEELRHLIAQYRAAGLTAVAEWLEIAQGGLEARGLLPPTLAGLPTEEAAGSSPRRSESPAAERTVGLRRDGPVYGDEVEQVASRYTHVALNKKDLTYELDRLGLPKRQRNALVLAGFRTVAEVAEAAELDILASVRNLSERSAREVTERVRAYMAAEAAARQQDTPQLPLGQETSDVPSGKQ